MDRIRAFKIFSYCLLVGLLVTPQIGYGKRSDNESLRDCAISFGDIFRHREANLSPLQQLDPEINLTIQDVETTRKIAHRENRIIVANNPRVSNARIRFEPNVEAKPVELHGCKSLKEGRWQGYVGCSPKEFSTRLEWQAYVDELRRMGYAVREESEQFLVERGETKFFSDLDLFGVWNADTLESGFDDIIQSALNSAFGVDLIRHGPWADYALRHTLSLPEESVAFLPDGQVLHLKNEDDLQRFVESQGIDWQKIWPHKRPDADLHPQARGVTAPENPARPDFVPISRHWPEEQPFVATGERYFVEFADIPGLRARAYTMLPDGKFRKEGEPIDILKVASSERAFVVGDNGNGTVILEFHRGNRIYRIENFPNDGLRRFSADRPFVRNRVGHIRPRTRLRVFDRATKNFVEAEYIGRQEYDSYSLVVLDPDGKRDIAKVDHSCIEAPGSKLDESACLFIFGKSNSDTNENHLVGIASEIASSNGSGSSVVDAVIDLGARFGKTVEEGQIVVYLDPMSGRWFYGKAGDKTSNGMRYVKRGQGHVLARFSEIRDPQEITRARVYVQGEVVRYFDGSSWLNARVRRDSAVGNSLDLVIGTETFLSATAENVERMPIVGSPPPGSGLNPPAAQQTRQAMPTQ